MSVRQLAELSWEACERMDWQRVVAILPAGAVEAHGPHLPLATDLIIAEAMARAGAAQLAADGYEPLLLPALAYAPAPFAAGFAGTISIRAETMTSLVLDIGRTVLEQGARCLAIANAHLDPAHLRALADAVSALNAAGLAVAFPDLTRRGLADRLTAEFRSGACHAGQYETSMVLAERPELVDNAARAGLPPVTQSLVVAIREGRRTFEEAGGARAYFGDPAAATAAEGAASIAELGRILADAVHAALVEAGDA